MASRSCGETAVTLACRMQKGPWGWPVEGEIKAEGRDQGRSCPNGKAPAVCERGRFQARGLQKLLSLHHERNCAALQASLLPSLSLLLDLNDTFESKSWRKFSLGPWRNPGRLAGLALNHTEGYYTRVQGNPDTLPLLVLSSWPQNLATGRRGGGTVPSAGLSESPRRSCPDSGARGRVRGGCQGKHQHRVQLIRGAL